MALARTFSVSLVGVSGRLVEIEADLSAGPARPDLHRAGRSVGAGISGTHPRRRAELRLLLAEQTDHRRAVAGRPAQARLDVRSGPGGLGTDRGRRAVDHRAWPTRSGSVNSGLDGRARPVRGVLPAVLAARRARHRHGGRAGRQRGRGRAGQRHPGAGCGRPAQRSWPRLDRPAHRCRWRSRRRRPTRCRRPTLADVVGQPLARRALEVAAAGAHHLLLEGSPGAGKTMLAERMPSILPALDEAAALEVTAIHSVAGVLPSRGRPDPTTAPAAAAPHLLDGGAGRRRRRIGPARRGVAGSSGRAGAG